MYTRLLLTLFRMGNRDKYTNCEKTAKVMDLKFCNNEFTYNTDLL